MPERVKASGCSRALVLSYHQLLEFASILSYNHFVTNIFICGSEILEMKLNFRLLNRARILLSVRDDDIYLKDALQALFLRDTRLFLY